MPRAYDPKAGNRAIFDALIDARDAYGAKKPVL
jgi:acyl-[acyl-carrier-protein]-phospholipid O-acyltransferase/long-chain-fatty-acid--[acyl-carrier-protein] ligase